MGEVEGTPVAPEEAAETQGAANVRAYRAHAAVPRTVLFTMRMNAEEHAAIKAVADRRGLRMARLIREAALHESYDRRERLAVIETLDTANRLLANVAGNINQLAHQANIAEQIVAEGELEVALGQIRELRAELAKALRLVK